MYSVVLMMALSGGTESADFGRRGCHGCDGGCTGVVVASCSCRGERRARKHRCHGCSAPACCGGVPVCCGGAPVCCGGPVVVCSGCYGAPVCSGYVCGGAPVCGGCAGGVIAPNPPPAMAPAKTMPKEKVPTPPKKVSAPATIEVSLPAEARLTVDGHATSAVSANRTFVSPALEPGADYVYTFQATIIADGRPIVQTRQVTVRGGQTTKVPFTFSTQGVASR